MTSEWDGTDWGGAAPTPPISRAGVPAVTTATRPAPAGPGSLPAPYLSTTTIVGLSAVWRCVTLIADVVSRMTWQEWRGDEQVPASRLVRKPCASMSRREWTWRVVATEALCNTGYVLHIAGYDAEGVPWSLLPVPPNAIAPINQDPWGMLPASEYMVAGQKVSIDQLSIVRRAPWPGINDNVAGIINLARREFQAYLSADNQMAEYWLNGGPATTVITTDQELDDPQADAISARWAARRAAGGAAVLGKGAHAEPWGADPTTETAVEARREIVADIGRYFGVPTRILNAPAGDSETYSNVESDAIDLLRYTCGGYIDPIQDIVSELLPGDPIAGRRMVIDPTQFVSGDLPTRATAYSALVAAGIVTVSEARVRGFGLSATPAPATTTSQDAQDALPAAMGDVTPNASSVTVDL